MHKISGILLLLFWLLIPAQLKSQTLPKDGAALNYRIVGFTFPSFDKNGYVLEIAIGKYNNIDSFKEHIIFRKSAKNNKIIAELPSFGDDYTWSVEGEQAVNAKKILHHFSVEKIPHDGMRLRIVKNATKYKDAYVFLDGARTLYDMNGNPVWFLPGVDHVDSNNLKGVTDLHLSPQKTITFLTCNTNAYEVDYNGKILWKKTGEYMGFHHAFTRLKNGHYMVLGNESLKWKADNKNNRLVFFAPGDKEYDSKEGNSKVSFGEITEYDKQGNEVWVWKSSSYYESLLKPLRNIYPPYNDVHANAFFFDEKNNYLYVSFKNASQILKIEYPQGKVVRAYSDTTISEGTKTPLFCMQHACRISKEGYLYFFNNNECNLDDRPQVLMLKEPHKATGSLKEIWSYQYPSDSTDKRIHRIKGHRITSGGNVIQLPGDDMFVSLCKPYANIFIVNKHKKLLWNAVSEKWSDNLKRWYLISQYRASIITNYKDFEQLIWNSEDGSIR